MDVSTPELNGREQLAVGVLAAVPTVLVAVASHEDSSVLFGSPAAFALFLGVVVVGSSLVTAIPAVLLAGFRLATPSVAVGGAVLFWAVLASGGDAHSVAFVALTAPTYPPVALAAGSVKHRLRFRSFLPSG